MTRTFDLSGATVLIIDDQPDNLRLVGDFLEAYGVDVMFGHDGVDGLAKAELGRPDLILLDVMMPDMDGFEVCRRLKRDRLLRDVPVIFLTALNEVEDKLRGFQAGGVDFLSKPLQELEVVARVDVHINLFRARRQAEAAARAKSEFLANMNHEIRTPMNAVLGYASLLQEVVVDKDSRSYLEAIQSAGKTLLKLIDNILDLSRIDSGRLELDYRPTDLHALVRDTLRIFAPKAREKGLEMSAEPAQASPLVLRLDETRIRQILLNLVGNALKFTHRGSVRVRVDAVPLAGAEVQLSVAVEDTGIGIPEDEQQAVFESFTQQRGQRHAEYGGTGLGLAICARLADLMGGHVALDSKVGIGSVFTLILPQVQRVELPRQFDDENDLQLHSASFAPAHILVVDDDPASRKLLAHMLTVLGFTAVQAKNGSDALTMVAQERPDLVMTDLNMPVLNGEETVRRLRSDTALAGLPVIAVTASVVGEDDSRLQEFDAVLIKPITRERLLNVIEPFVLPADTGAQADTDPMSIPPTPIRLPATMRSAWERVCRHPAINEVEAFADQLRDLGGGDPRDVRCLWGQRLADAADQFDPKVIRTVVARMAEWVDFSGE